MALRRGSRGPQVTTLQQQLIERGHLDGPADGDFGPKTEAAVRAFQRSAGLDDDGVAGPQTMGALGGSGSGGSERGAGENHVSEQMALDRRPDLRAAGQALGLDVAFCDDALMNGQRQMSFADYLGEHDIRYFSHREVVTPNHPDRARQAGYDDLTPPRHLWPWAVLVLTLGDALREAVGSPVTLRNLYRPMSYNRLVASSGIRSDHPNGAGGDYDFGSVAERRTAEAEIRRIAAEHAELQVSLGLGARTLHVGCLSPQGSRSWYYDSYSDRRVPFP